MQIDRLHIGGWADASFRDSGLDEMEASHLSLNHLNGFLDLRFEDRWQVFVEAELEYQPPTETLRRDRDAELEQAYLRLLLSEALELRVGKFSTPFGYWTPVHWTIDTDTVLPPLFESRRIVPEQQLGARVGGKRFFRMAPDWDLRLDYTLFGGYGARQLELDDARGTTGGADLRLGLERRGFVGVSFYTQHARGLRSPRERETASMLYGELSLPAHLTLRGEYLLSRGARVAGADRRRSLFYAKLLWRPGKWLFNYRFERAEDLELGPQAIHRVHRFTVGYTPFPRLRLRAEYARHLVQRSRIGDFHGVAFWLGVFF